MTTPCDLRWTILPAPTALARLREAGGDTTLAGEWQPGPIALLHPANDHQRILGVRPARTPDLVDALLARTGPGSAGTLATAITDAAGDWWRIAHIWSTCCRWHPDNSRDWRSQLDPCPAPDGDGLSALLAPTRGWLLWDFQWMAVLLAGGVDWEAADALRQAWNLDCGGTRAALAAWRFADHPLDQVIMVRTQGPDHSIGRIDAWAVQRLANWAREQAPPEPGHLLPTSSVGFSLSGQEARRVREWAGPIAAAMQDKAIEFPGIEFVLGSSPCGDSLQARIGGATLDLR